MEDLKNIENDLEKLYEKSDEYDKEKIVEILEKLTNLFYRAYENKYSNNFKIEELYELCKDEDKEEIFW